MSLSNIFPSKTIAIYMAKMFLVRTFAILFAVALVLQTLDVLSESGAVLAAPGNGQAQVWRYVSLRAPQIISFLLPFSVLLGTILTFFTMNQNSEVIALKAAGMSAHQVLAPLLIASAGVAAFSFVFNDRIVPRASATLSAWQKVQYGPLPIDSGDRSNVWVRDGDDLISVDLIQGRGTGIQLGGVTLYDRAGGSLQAIVRAPRGVRAGDGWKIGPVTRFEVKSGKLTNYPSLIIGRGVTPEQLTLASVSADNLSFGALSSAITDLREAGRPTKSLEGSLWHKLSAPMSAMLMPLLGAVAAFGIARSGKLFVRAVIGMALGFAYFVADNFSMAMGDLGAYPPFLAAWAPILLFFLIGEAVLFRTEE
ncbi:MULTISPECIES: LPS export ABC transporter permease LptG [Sphingomonas]|jgi:lipopolysaccharide export system permease protein|uniref:LPS export ABC transporter permease LptG n=1 Tax=Sphingomonas zeae TaxID=1646122 RepID=A0A7Y6B9G3_9SPHN|nr:MULTISPECIES: LPS export ABC transporter permease LptG [Sphingomonas]MBB4047092.1 lipopolysaccharide export system permease protein [Sphingomonas zeae]MDK8186890.1 LPS export ABC transporter permease LptG [Sphingomonas zeae]MDK8214119.1 LPS export ABC transporter permease LptG [Sphingomonas sp. UMB7805-LC452B]NUU49198.1 LPS export ABC transporter permease LptG [Sphingomonas zeae]